MKRTNGIPKRIMALLLSLAMALALCACGDTAANESTSSDTSEVATVSSTSTEESSTAESSFFPVTIGTSCFTKDNEEWVDVDQTLETTPTKVLVGGSEMLDFMVYFGLEDLVYGVACPGSGTRLTGDLKEVVDSIPVITEDWDVTPEEIYAAADAGVDLILTGYVLIGLPSSMDVSELNELGINLLYAYDMEFDGSYKLSGSHLVGISDMFDFYRDLGQLFGIQDKVEDYIKDQRAQMREILKLIETSETEASEVYFLVYNGVDTFHSNYSGTTIQDYVEFCGGTWIGDYTGINTPTYETLLELDPEVIICRYDGVDPDVGPDVPFEEIESLQSLSAIQNGKVYTTYDLPFTSNTGGIDMAAEMREVASMLYPDVDFGV